MSRALSFLAGITTGFATVYIFRNRREIKEYAAATAEHIADRVTNGPVVSIDGEPYPVRERLVTDPVAVMARSRYGETDETPMHVG